MFDTFDAPSGEACIARREVSNTPLQALTLLNDAVFIEAAQALGRTLAAQPRRDRRPHRAMLFRRCLTRPPTDDEMPRCSQFFQTQRQRFAAKELDAGSDRRPGDGDATERAAWTAARARAVQPRRSRSPKS